MYEMPFQNFNFGPKATLKKQSKSSNVTTNLLHNQLLSNTLSQQLTWIKSATNVLVIKKDCNNIFEFFTTIITYLVEKHHLIVYIEEKDFNNELLDKYSQILEYKSSNLLRVYVPCVEFNECLKHTDGEDQIDLVICLGGDGTLLHVSTLFQQSCPPVLSIHMGSLGFLCPFEFESYKEYISSILKGNVPILVRSRLKCRFEKSIETLLKNSIENSIQITSNNTNGHDNTQIINENNLDALLPLEWLSLNEVVIGRGQSSFLTNIDLYINDYLITTVQGDGLIVSTPTGSTAYAMAAGASMCHPSVPSIVIAPICPHSLSFRPIVVPAGVELKIQVSAEARNTASFSVDGRANHELKRGYQLTITTSEYPLPSICRNGQLNDWFEGLATCLHWNQRQKQLPLNSCYLNSHSSSSLSNSQSSSTSSSETNSLVNSKSSSNYSLKTLNNLINDQPPSLPSNDSI